MRFANVSRQYIIVPSATLFLVYVYLPSYLPCLPAYLPTLPGYGRSTAVNATKTPHRLSVEVSE